MSAHAAIAPAAEIQVRRPPVGRMVIVAVAYLAIVIGSAVYVLISPLNPTILTEAALTRREGLSGHSVKRRRWLSIRTTAGVDVGARTQARRDDRRDDARRCEEGADDRRDGEHI